MKPQLLRGLKAGLGRPDFQFRPRKRRSPINTLGYPLRPQRLSHGNKGKQPEGSLHRTSSMGSKASVLTRMQTAFMCFIFCHEPSEVSLQKDSLLQCNTFCLQPMFAKEKFRRERDTGWQDGAKRRCCCLGEVTMLPWRVPECSFMGQMWSVWEGELAGRHFKVCSRGLAGGNNGLQL